MNRAAVVLIVLFIGANLIAQTAKIPLDTIVRMGGRKIPCKVLNVSTTTVLYSTPDKKESQALERKEVERIIYRTGTVDILNKPPLEVIKEGQWQTVLITRDEKDIQGLYNRGNIKSKSSPSPSKKAAKQSAIIKLQKKAASLGGTTILLTKEEVPAGYSDDFYFEMEGVVYGTEPLEKGTDVIKEKGK
jgi:hypothetical protein